MKVFIKDPKVGMTVEVIDETHCCNPTKGNHAGNGVIIEISGFKSFAVKMDKFPNEYWHRCGACTIEIKGGKSGKS